MKKTTVVISFKISIFALANTTYIKKEENNNML